MRIFARDLALKSNYKFKFMDNYLFLLRLGVGAVFIYHAIPKLKEPKTMAAAMGWTAPQMLGLGTIEFMAGLGLIGGVAVNISSLALSAVMIGAIYHKIYKWHVPFMSLNSTGWELDFLLLCASLTIYLN